MHHKRVVSLHDKTTGPVPEFEMYCTAQDVLNNDEWDQLSDAERADKNPLSKGKRIELISDKLREIFLEKIPDSILSGLGTDVLEVAPSVTWNSFKRQMVGATVSTDMITNFKSALNVKVAGRKTLDILSEIQTKVRNWQKHYTNVVKEVENGFSGFQESARLIVMLQYSALPDKERSKLNMTSDMWTDPSIFYKTVGTKCSAEISASSPERPTKRKAETQLVNAVVKQLKRGDLPGGRFKRPCLYCKETGHWLYTKASGQKVWTCPNEKGRPRKGFRLYQCR